MTSKKEIQPIQYMLGSIFDKIPHVYKLSFVTTFIIGFLSNLFAYTNNLINHDTINEAYRNLDFSFSLEQGRWLQYIFRVLGTIYPSPIIHGLFGLFALSLSAGFICAVFHLNDKISIILLSALLGVFPINACFYSYMYMADIYYVSLFFSVLAVFFVERGGIRNFIFGSVSLLCSVAIYQAFVSITIAFIVAIYFFQLLHVEQFHLKKWFFSALRDTFMVAAGFILYAVATRILLFATGMELHDYGGVSKSFSISLENIPLSILITFIDIKTFYFSTDWIQHKFFVLANIIIALIFVIIMLWTLYRYAKKKNFGMIFICIAYYIILPFLIDNIFIIMNLRGDVHMLMHYVYTVPYIMLLVLMPELFILFDSAKKKYAVLCKKFANTLSALGIAAMITVTYFCFIISNQLYCRMSNIMTAANSSLTTMMTRIESIDGWDLTQPVYIANAHAILNTNLYPDLYFYDQLGSVLWTGTDIYPWGGSNQIYDYLSRYFNIDLVRPTEQQEQAIRETDAFARMPVYPAEGSIREINSIIVIKMEE